MREAWMAMDQKRAQTAVALAGERFASRTLVGLLAVAALACSDAARISDSDRLSEEVSLIDDMEDGTQYILSDDGRVGLWYTYNDMSPTGTQEPAVGFPMFPTLQPNGAQTSPLVPPRACGGGTEAPFFANEEICNFVARTAGTGQRGWGAGMGVDLNGEGGAKNPFDASEFGGIGFFVQGNVRDGEVRVNVQDVRTTPESAAAADRRGIERCTDEPTRRCNDHYGFVVTGVRPDAWRWVAIPFQCLSSGMWGYPGNSGMPDLNRLRADAIVGVQFQVEGADPADTGMPNLPVREFDFSIDNLAFLRNVDINTPCPAPVQ
jgi:hypothetical protein